MQEILRWGFLHWSFCILIFGLIGKEVECAFFLPMIISIYTLVAFLPFF